MKDESEVEALVLEKGDVGRGVGTGAVAVATVEVAAGFVGALVMGQAPGVEAGKNRKVERAGGAGVGGNPLEEREAAGGFVAVDPSREIDAGRSGGRADGFEVENRMAGDGGEGADAEAGCFRNGAPTAGEQWIIVTAEAGALNRPF
jgi:hypothetical protein